MYKKITNTGIIGMNSISKTIIRRIRTDDPKYNAWGKNFTEYKFFNFFHLLSKIIEIK